MPTLTFLTKDPKIQRVEVFKLPPEADGFALVRTTLRGYVGVVPQDVVVDVVTDTEVLPNTFFASEVVAGTIAELSSQGYKPQDEWGLPALFSDLTVRTP